MVVMVMLDNDDDDDDDDNDSVVDDVGDDADWWWWWWWKADGMFDCSEPNFISVVGSSADLNIWTPAQPVTAA